VSKIQDLSEENLALNKQLLLQGIHFGLLILAGNFSLIAYQDTKHMLIKFLPT
jgi:hypothetical protein